MKRILSLILAGLFVLGLTTVAFADSSPDQAKALVKEAVAYVKANGKDKALAEFSNPKGQFVKADLYIFVVDMNGVMIAHGANQKLIGTNMMDKKDPDGVPFIKKFVEVGKQGGGWVDYKWPHPVTKQVTPKTSYVEEVDGIIVGCGVHK
ncbi:MAG: histidine kinase [Desulfuromonadales bacterium]|nr:MAG: histidine kinase [Desulfuromonadales bacterium]